MAWRAIVRFRAGFRMIRFASRWEKISNLADSFASIRSSWKLQLKAEEEKFLRWEEKTEKKNCEEENREQRFRSHRLREFADLEKNHEQFRGVARIEANFPGSFPPHSLSSPTSASATFGLLFRLENFSPRAATDEEENENPKYCN